MVAAESADDALLQHFLASQREGIGQFVVEPDTDRWRWSPSLYAIFDRDPEAFVPSWDAILSHIPEPERALIDDSYRRADVEWGPFGWSHRLITGRGVLRAVIVIGDVATVGSGPGAVAADPGEPHRRLRGFVMDVTALRIGGAHAAADEAVQRSRQHQATIEQAKGALMLAYRLSPRAAFELLAWHSSRTNRTLHLVAADLVEAVQRADLGNTRLRATVDNILTDQQTRQ